MVVVTEVEEKEVVKEVEEKEGDWVVGEKVEATEAEAMEAEMETVSCIALIRGCNTAPPILLL